MGRSPEITPEISKYLIDAISDGVPYAVAIEAAGFCEATIYNWLNYGIADRESGKETLCRTFLESIKKVEMAYIRELLSKVKDGVDRWQSCAWILERRWRQHFGADAGIIQELLASFKALQEKMNSK